LERTRTEALAWRDRLDTWEHQIGLRLQEQEAATAMSLDTIQLKFNEIRSAVPQVIETEVGGQIDEVESLLIAGFRDLSRGNQSLQQQLEDTRLLLTDARSELQTGNQLARDAQSERREIRGQISGLASETAALVSRIHEFDRTRLQCNTCPEYLDLRKRKIADIAEFHNDIVQHLSVLQGNMIGPVDSSEEAPSENEDGG
jgi:chromosome segregation ATPase